VNVITFYTHALELIWVSVQKCAKFKQLGTR